MYGSYNNHYKYLTRGTSRLLNALKFGQHSSNDYHLYILGFRAYLKPFMLYYSVSVGRTVFGKCYSARAIGVSAPDSLSGVLKCALSYPILPGLSGFASSAGG
jgi:hypothetical protein